MNFRWHYTLGFVFGLLVALVFRSGYSSVIEDCVALGLIVVGDLLTNALAPRGT